VAAKAEGEGAWLVRGGGRGGGYGGCFGPSSAEGPADRVGREDEGCDKNEGVVEEEGSDL
jgi:hypothetical protein